MSLGLVCPQLSSSFEEGINNLQLVPTEAQTLSPTDVRIAVHAAALNFFDLLMLVGQYQVKPKLPFVMCTEGAGEIIEVGSEVKDRKKGERVYFFPKTPGTAAQEIVIPSSFCYSLSSKLTYAQGAGFSVGYMTSFHGIVQRGKLQKSETLLVTGAAGGMGIAAVQIGKLIGATVIAAASDDKKLAILKTLGADHVINYAMEDLRESVARITNNKFCDVIFDPVGGNIFTQCVRVIAPNGRLLVIGFASGEIPKLPINLALIRGFSLVGVRAGAQLNAEPDLKEETYRQLNAWADEGRLKPYVGFETPLENYQEAFRKIMDRSIIGKSVLLCRPPSRL
eukprot:TRINITY_DN1615_c0_g1_i2.p1 TRINITY_DN1615_c0_g1~~TRINITY_DN1615_c0_g1_i2.p1  ORF type:complete len:338 (-),score=66.08 TRINITY_DN1615_c0_g1_i2:902-1915(-)